MAIDGVMWGACVAAGEDARMAMKMAIQESYSKNLSQKTGHLFASIDSRVLVEPLAGDRVLITLWGEAGGIDPRTGNWCWHGWFHEYGTGLYVENRTEALKGYLDKGGQWKPFFEQRPQAGKGWWIVSRTEPGRKISRGVKATHWFRDGTDNGMKTFHAIGGELAGLLARMRGLGDKIEGWARI